MFALPTWLLLIFLAGLLYGAYIDFKTMRVPNYITLSLLALATIYRFPNYSPDTLLFVFLVFLAWKSGFLGGADAKLWMSAAVLWNTQTGIIAAGLSMLITSLIVLALAKLKNNYQPFTKRAGAWKVIPYLVSGILLGFV